MRMSCNGCRVLRKGCSDDCTIRPCLQWIKSPDAQANATLFLAKFYGRAGLINLVEAGPQHLRPAVFRSLLYEACGRIVNPVYGSVGLLWSGNWAHCQSAVDSVLRGTPIIQMPSPSSDAPLPPQMIDPLKTYDIRHVSKEADQLNKVKNRTRFKRPVNRPPSGYPTDHHSIMGFEPQWASLQMVNGDHSSKDDESMLCVETVEDANQNEPNHELGLDLTLGLLPVQ
ncbi:LOB domain-containing protein 42-like [Mercurialis annua]|uniref:LOB domain-containing protein 42-like n=1 Tax=Mercurialis annua TaxID=3986 RepID=UPI00215F69DC|nr:LOB domain-containing protein 42-like [Mercurialis annua]